MDPRKMKDKRVLERNLERGFITLKEVEEAKKDLKDVSEKATKVRIKLGGE